MVLLALFALGAGVYGVANYWGPEFGIMVVVYMVTLWTFESIAQFLSALFRNPLLGMLVFICVWWVNITQHVDHNVEIAMAARSVL